MRPISNLFLTLVPVAVSVLAGCAHNANSHSSAGSSACRDAVTQSMAKEFPTATMSACRAEHEDGQDLFEVKLNSGGEKIEVDVAPDGMVLQTEVAIAVDQVPAKVMTSLTARYPTAKPTKAEKQVRTGKGTYYELTFLAERKATQVTFAEDGSLVEEE
jgi:hypothetical protein